MKKRNTSQSAVEQAIARAGGGTDWGPAVEIGPRPSLNAYLPGLTDYALEQLTRLTQIRFPDVEPEPPAIVVEAAVVEEVPEPEPPPVIDNSETVETRTVEVTTPESWQAPPVIFEPRDEAAIYANFRSILERAAT